VVVVVAIAAYIAASFDANQYKPQIVQAVKDATQRTLKLDGDIRLSFFPDIGATIGKAWLSERAGDGEFAGADDFRLALKLVPLLSKRVVIDAIEVKNLRANLTRYKDGRTNFDDLAAGGAKSAPAANGEGPQVGIEINHVAVENAAISYTDEAGGTKYALSKLNLRTGRIAGGVPGKIELSFTLQSDKPKLDLETAFTTTVSFDLEKKSYALNGFALRAKGLAAGISDLAASAQGEIDAKPAGHEYRVSKLAVVIAGRQQGAELNVRLDAPGLTVARDQLSTGKIALDAIMSHAGGRMTAKLGISGIAGSVEAQKFELAKMEATVNVNHPGLPKNPVDAVINGSALVDFAGQNASLAFTARFDDSSVSGKAGLAKFTPPSYTFDVNIDQLDADRYLPKPDPKHRQPEQPLDLSALQGLNAHGSLRIGSLKVSNVRATNVRVDVKAAAGRVEVSPIVANLDPDSRAGAANAALKTRAAEIKTGAQDQVRDRLKGLIGR